MTHTIHYDAGFKNHRALCNTPSPLYTTSNVRSVTCKRCKQKLADIKRRSPSY